MKKRILAIMVASAMVILSGCGDNTLDGVEKVTGHIIGGGETYAVEEYTVADETETQDSYSKDDETILENYSLNDEGVWVVENQYYTYKYRRVLSGKLNGPEKDFTFVVLTNKEDALDFQEIANAVTDVNNKYQLDPKETLLVEVHQ